MKAYRWIYSKGEYKETDIPDGSSVYENDMDKMVQCANCGKKFMYGDCYTSKEIHTKHGIGYAVCPKCSLRENDEERKYVKAERGNGWLK